eukprot:gene50602-61896_t
MAPRPIHHGNAHLPPHLREVCSILARGLVRLRSRAAEDEARDAEIARGEGTRMTRRSTVAPTAALTIPKIPPTQVLSRLAALQAAPTATLKEQWRELFGKEPPPWNRAYIQSRLAYRIQELAYGGLKPETVDRLVALGEHLDGGNVVLRRIRADSRPLAGTRLIREWQGEQHA